MPWAPSTRLQAHVRCAKSSNRVAGTNLIFPYPALALLICLAPVRCPHVRETCRNRALHPKCDVVYLKNAEGECCRRTYRAPRSPEANMLPPVQTFNGCGFCKVCPQRFILRDRTDPYADLHYPSGRATTPIQNCRAIRTLVGPAAAGRLTLQRTS